ncbi:MAG: hypothetical protein J5518_04920 [Lachnospiraceae bacterium]|nr:hypothetical protein [Lachnospiraceae bacterium]
MKTKIFNIVFIVLFMAVLIVPVIFMNTKENQISAIDNKILTEWPGFSPDLSSREELENYLSDRIGFREQAIETYIELNDKLFYVMVHPLFMYGQDGHIFFKEDSYIEGYQRLNTDGPYLDSMVDFLQRTTDYLNSKDIRFLYYLCPDKKSIYPEYFPKSIHVNTENESVIDHMKSSLSKTDVDYIIPTDELIAAKQDRVVYNKKYDATHWNEFGAFLGHKLIDDKIQQWFDDVPPLTEDDFDLTYETMETLDVAKFPINESVPVYTLKEERAEDSSGYLEPYLKCTTTNFYTHYKNPNCPNDRILLVFTDSYFASYVRFYTNRFKEVYFIHRQNYDYLQYMVNLTFPDMVVFETAERSIMGEMVSNADFTDYYYEPPYPGVQDLKKTEDVTYLVTSTVGVRRDGATLYLNPEVGENIISLSGRIKKTDPDKTYRIYAHVQEVYLEADYCALHRIAEFDGLDEFSFSVQRRYMAQGPIELIAVDTDSGEQFLLETFEVIYGQ